jgi:CheY-like chemotaxis protein
MGISKKMLSQIFELFTQVDGSLDRSQGGLGIGLTLVRSLTELHGGRVQAASDGLGKGSTFTVVLPRSKVAPVENPRISPTSIQPKRASSRVLVVDDNVDTARLTAEFLKMSGFDVETAHTGLQALEAARLFKPDVMLLDIGLPGMDGYQLAERVREDNELKETLLIAVSGYGQKQDRSRSREAGFDQHLVKPVDFEVLISLISKSYDRFEQEPKSVQYQM